MSERQDRYVPASGRAALTGAYDVAVALTMREARWRPLVIERVAARARTGATVVDVGAGTGTLAIGLAAARPDLVVIAVDGDPGVLERARGKPGAGRVRWRHGFADRLDADDGAADAVVMSLLLHHLPVAGKRKALAEARRVLRPRGRLLVADWGRPHDRLMRAAFGVLQLLDGIDNTRDHAAGRVPGFVADAGFHDLRVLARLRTAWGTLDVIEAT